VIVALADGLWIGLGSDHTDRKAETMGIALSKQLCGKVMGPALWRFERDQRALGPDHDPLARDDRRTRTLYQEGPLAAMRHPDDLIARYGARRSRQTPSCSAARSARRAASGRPRASRWSSRTRSCKRRMSHAYDIVDLPVIT
jgi:hypothetical protein